MIPRPFFWLMDLFSLGLSFVAAYAITPSMQRLIVHDGILRFPWLEVFSLPSLDFISQFPSIGQFSWIMVGMILPVLIFSEAIGAYRLLPEQSRSRIISGGLLAPISGLSFITLIMFALKTPAWSRLFLFSFTGLSGLALSVYRLTSRFYLRRRQEAGFYAKNVLIIAKESERRWLENYFEAFIPESEYRILGHLRIGPKQNPDDQKQSGEAVRQNGVGSPKPLGQVMELGELLIHTPVHEVIAIQPADGGGWLNQVVRDCDYYRVTLRIVPEALLDEDLHNLGVMFHLLPLRLPDIVLRPRHMDTEALFFKRVFDLVASAVMMILLLPLFGLVAVAIKLTTPRLPIFYRWNVVGQNGAEFTGYKFTTMWADADERKADLLAQNIMDGPVFKIDHDPRITPLGRFLRKFSLNELPQLWSVLEGDMSLVGPRPAFKHELERYEFWQKRKLSIRPGITCLWQVRGRNRIRKFDDWVRMDMEYIDNWSLWLDFKILFRTIWVVLSGTGS